MARVTVQLRDGRTKEMPERYANLLIRVGRAHLVTARDPKSKRVYRRRDMQAEVAAAPSEPEEVVEATEVVSDSPPESTEE